MGPLQHAPDPAHREHLEEARRVLALPIAASGLRWHPFGVYVIPLARRHIEGHDRVRRLHLWHPNAKPVGPASPYGVHTHTGTAYSHVLIGALHHYLYEFCEDPDGVWLRTALGGQARRETLTAHAQATTTQAMLHTLPAHQPHSVSKPPGLAISLFEQVEQPAGEPFTTWQRQDMPAEELVRKPPVPLAQVLAEMRLAVEQTLYATS